MTDMAAPVHTLSEALKLREKDMKKDLGTRIIDALLLVFCCLFFLPDKRKNFLTLMMGPVDFLIATLGFIFSLFFVLLV